MDPLPYFTVNIMQWYTMPKILTLQDFFKSYTAKEFTQIPKSPHRVWPN